MSCPYCENRGRVLVELFRVHREIRAALLSIPEEVLLLPITDPYAGCPTPEEWAAKPIGEAADCKSEEPGSIPGAASPA